MFDLQKIRPTVIEINLDNLAYNFRQVRDKVSSDSKIMAIVKANGYGHGAIEVSRLFLESGADMLGVSIVSEAIELRKANINLPILILNYTPPTQLFQVVENNLIQTIYTFRDASLLSKIAVLQETVAKIHIKVDTGMGRLGFVPNDNSLNEIIKIAGLPNIKVEGIYTHFPCADEKDKSITKTQFSIFCNFINKLNEKGVEIPIKHVSNSASIIDFPEYNLDMVRAGAILYGHYPSSFVNRDYFNIKPAVTLKSIISNVKWVPRGSGISYGHTFITNRDSKIATVPLGYTDGYSRMLSGKAKVYINGKKAPIVGLICMDQLMIDVTEIKGVQVDDEVVLLGYENESYPTVEDISSLLQTNDDDVICMLGRRIPRVYIRNGEVCDVIDYILD